MLQLFDGVLSMSELQQLTIPEITALTEAKLRMIKQKNKAFESARKMEKDIDKAMKFGF